MNLKIVLILSSAFTFACVAFAGIDIDAPSQFSAPLYWSGTNCRIYASAQATGNDSIGRCRLSLSDGTTEEEVFDETYGGPPLRVLREAAYMFDSTAFQCGTTLTVKMEAWTLYNVHYQKTYSAPVKNYATLAQLEDFSDFPANGRTVIELGLSFCNYCSYTGFESLWTSYDYLQSLVGCNFAYINTHALIEQNNNLLKSDYGWEVPEPEGGPEFEEWYLLGHIFPQTAPYNGVSLLDYRTAQIGGGVPPINSTANPPINIAYNDACMTGFANDYAEGYLFPYTNQYTMPFECENQAQIGWKIDEYIDAKYPCALTFTSMLYSSYCIESTRDAMFYTYFDWCDSHGQECQAEGAELALHVWGDFATKLKGVYTGDVSDDEDSEPVTEWIREIEY